MTHAADMLGLLRQVRAAHAEQLETQRRAAEASAQQRLIAHEVQITKALKDEHKRKLTQVGWCLLHEVQTIKTLKDEHKRKPMQEGWRGVCACGSVWLHLLWYQGDVATHYD
eukprot:1002028-Pelagomonas_calceolata.AAC.2